MTVTRWARIWLQFPACTLLQLDCEIVLEHPRRIPIDLHWALSPADFPFPLDAELMWRSRTVIEMGGAPVPVLGRECLLVYLAVHGAKHAWSRLLWLGDMVRAIDNGIDWSAALRLATEAGCTRPLLLGLLLSHDLLEAAVPEAILQQARGDAAVVAAAGESAARVSPPHPARGAVQHRADGLQRATGARRVGEGASLGSHVRHTEGRGLQPLAAAAAAALAVPPAACGSGVRQATAAGSSRLHA